MKGRNIKNQALQIIVERSPAGAGDLSSALFFGLSRCKPEYRGAKIFSIMTNDKRSQLCSG